MQYEVNPFCVRGQEKDFPSLRMVYWKCPGLCTFFFNTTSGTYCVCSIMQLFRLLGIVKIFSHVNAQTVLWWL